ncbi:class I SAM-dependent methyltransferase [Alkaliphilus sp. MSJ-5]|uniref:Class I SAM-dependent methyltransferase n=1 Tax=Alkaliphilus flagellatus TaxID=2841507 RepID=A0ABS6G8F3_9FIRM|nr:class I SAM-dependent methyltransferase [Alkaliphilus flagellatus]MBU5677987.1 class I SAM-dependent methyltransferase [Alkaliphilus flagellatus]
MELSPRLYRILVRPKWFSKFYVENVIKRNIMHDHKRVLDFGCGIGSNCSMFDSSKYIGLDCDKRRIKEAKKLYPKYEFATLECSTLPVDDKSIDYILIFSVLHHIDSQELKGCLKEFHRVLRHQGRILIIEPYFKPQAVLTNNCMRYVDRGNYIRTEEEYLSMFNNNKYETKVINRYSQLVFYNKLFFIASPI